MIIKTYAGRLVFAALLLPLSISLLLPCVTFAQTFPSHDVKVEADSGDHFNHKTEPMVVWTKTITVTDAKWLRLHFERIVLAYDPDGNTTSTLKITSSKDGAFQTLNAVSAQEWQNTSAYFNGNEVRLELIAYPNGRLNRVNVKMATAGEIPVQTRSICDGADDRFLSNDPRVGRTVPGGCTAWLFNDQRDCLLTAGHCAASTSVIEFNVPISNPDGSYNHPGPDHQYPVDPDSMQSASGNVGNDWAYFGCFENSNTGLTAFEAQGNSFQLTMPQPVSGSDVIRITGYGTTSAPVDPSYNGSQKTLTGPHATFSGSALGYRTDTTGGNSGSPVILDNDGTAIGIHTHGGCTTGGGGTNSGTGANNAGFQNALANPLGVCKAAINMAFPNGRPALINPAGGTTMQVIATNAGLPPEPGTGMLHYDDGSGFQSIPMTETSPNVYEAVFPATICGDVVDYYVSAEGDDGSTFNSPGDAPVAYYSVMSASALSSLFDDNFESNLGWTVSGDATDGQWERGVPAGGGVRGDPNADGDGSGSCFVTDNVSGNSDVDGGHTILTSPIIDASASMGDTVVLTYYRWFDNDNNGVADDVMLIDISNDGGATWSSLEILGPTGSESTGGWIKKTFCVNELLTPTNQMRLRFDVADINEASIVEAGVDGVRFDVVECINELPATGSKFLDGEIVGGTLADLEVSDDIDLQLDPSQTKNPVKQTIEWVLQREVADDSPTTFGFRLESQMLGGPVGDVVQAIELFNYDSGEYELLDSRDAAVTETIVEVNATGDLSRFVEPITNEVTTRVSFDSLTFDGAPFFWSIDVDQLVWLID